jgi:hypothetical protein
MRFYLKGMVLDLDIDFMGENNGGESWALVVGSGYSLSWPKSKESKRRQS